MLTQNATWCQNRGCICISSIRRTYGRIHIPANNNSVDRIISKEEEREDPRRELQSIFEYSGVSTFLQELQDFFEYSVFYSVSHAIQQLQVILHTELILLQEFSKKYYNYKAHPVQISTRHLPVTAPVSPSILHGRIRLLAPYSTSRLPVILPGRNSTPSGSQHPHNPYSSSQAHFYRILPGEIGFIPKGSSIVYLCNTKVSVFQFTHSCT